jgi:hypothetical protein
LEYCASVWDPWQKKYINQIEMVQHRAVRFILNDYKYTSSITNLLRKINLPTLETRRKITSLCMFYKIKHNLVRIPFPHYIHHTQRHRYSIPFSRIDGHRHSFFPRTAKIWNSLPPDIAQADSLALFKTRLYSHCF